MAYSEIDKLQHEVEKLILEIKTLKKPYYFQPTAWVTLTGLLISISVNLQQCSDKKKQEMLNEIQYRQTQLDYNVLKVRKDSIQKETDYLDEKNSLAKAQLENNQTRITQLQEELKTLEGRLTSVNSTETKALVSNISQSLTRIGNVNLKATQNFDGQQGRANEELKKDLSTAKMKEEEGYQNLINGDLNAAFNSFQASENAYNGYHWSYEMTRFLKDKRNETDPQRKKEIIKIIIDKFSKGVSPQILARLTQAYS